MTISVDSKKIPLKKELNNRWLQGILFSYLALAVLYFTNTDYLAEHNYFVSIYWGYWGGFILLFAILFCNVAWFFTTKRWWIRIFPFLFIIPAGFLLLLLFVKSLYRFPVKLENMEYPSPNGNLSVTFYRQHNWDDATHIIIIEGFGRLPRTLYADQYFAECTPRITWMNNETVELKCPAYKPFIFTEKTPQKNFKDFVLENPNIPPPSPPKWMKSKDSYKEW